MLNPEIEENDAIEPIAWLESKWFRWLAIFGIWSLFLPLGLAQMSFGSMVFNRPIPWWRVLLMQVPTWYSFALLTPTILWLGNRYRIERHHLARSLSIHILFSLLFAAMYGPLASALMLAISLETPPGLGWFAQLSLRTTFNSLSTSLLKYWAITGVGYAVDYYRKYRQHELHASRLEMRTSQLEMRLAQSQLQTLKMQLHPHFLFNTLHTVSALMDEDIKAARRMIARLSELLRLTLENSGQQEVPLRQELDYLERYLEIEQIRFQDRLVVTMSIEPDTFDAAVPNLILQPLVENAIRHGIAPHSSAGRIAVQAWRVGPGLRIKVSDDGPGVSDPSSLREGIGLANTRARLAQLYGADQQIEISNEPGGFSVTMLIPFHLSADGQAEPEKS